MEDKIIVEFKAVDAIAPAHKAQIICYLRTLSMTIGLLVNFSLRGVEIERLANFPQTVEMVQIHDYLMESGLKNLRLTDSCDEIKIIKGICEVFNELGYGYLESVYLRALTFELGVS